MYDAVHCLRERERERERKKKFVSWGIRDKKKERESYLLARVFEVLQKRPSFPTDSDSEKSEICEPIYRWVRWRDASNCSSDIEHAESWDVNVSECEHVNYLWICLFLCIALVCIWVIHMAECASVCVKISNKWMGVKGHLVKWENDVSTKWLPTQSTKEREWNWGK